MEQVFISLISLGSIGLLFGVVLSVLDTKLKVEVDPLVEDVLKSLPGLNCGVCGFPGCKAFAEAVVKEKDLFKGCLPGGEEVNAKVAGIVGSDKLCAATMLRVVVLCGAQGAQKLSSFEYKGPQTCNVADVSLANIDCRYGCMGFADCVGVCPTRALRVEEKLVRVDYTKCIGCGSCVKVCPRGILQLREVSSTHLDVVSCSNPETGPATKKVCPTGCIGCGICTKIIKDSPFYLEKGLSKIDCKRIKEKTPQDMQLAREKCPVKIINEFSLQQAKICVDMGKEQSR